MKYNLKQGYVRKMQVFVTEKIKILDEAEINLQKVDRSGNLLPRKVNRNSNIVKRHKAIHEGAARKKVILKSQVTAKNLAASKVEPEDDLLIPYKKVSFLPAYFYKVFIKKKKQPPQKEKPGAKKLSVAGGKVDPRASKSQTPGAPEQDKDGKNVINLKTKKLMEDMKQDNDDYKQVEKIKVEKLAKTITKKSKFGETLNRYNARRKRYVEAITALRDKNAPLKKFDELEWMLNSYENTLFHSHLFIDSEESHLTKLDLYYANQHHVYNEGLISIDLHKTVLLQYACEHLVIVPLAFLIDRLVTTDGFMFLEMY